MILSVVSAIVIPAVKLSAIMSWAVASVSNSAKDMNSAAVRPEDAKEEVNLRLVVNVIPAVEEAVITFK